MLLKSQRRAYVRYDDGARSVKYYNAETQSILTSQNYCFLTPSNSSPPKELLIEPRSNDPPLEGEHEREEKDKDNCKDHTILYKQPAETEANPRLHRKTRGIRVDYRYLNDPFPDEEARIVYVEKDQAFAVLPDDKCQNLTQAKSSLEWPEWEQAIQSELAQLECMGTWKLVNKPHDAIPITNKFVFTKKRDKDGNLLKYKARLVAKGYAQQLGYDFVNTHSPIVQLETIRAILAITPLYKLYIHQLDVKGAYLNGILKEKIYMKQPEGYSNGTQ